jgi:hypothetical protein
VRSGRRDDLASLILVAWAANTLAWTWRLGLVIARAGADRRRDHVERDPLLISAIASTRCCTLAAVASRPGRPVIARNTLGALGTIFARATLGAIVTGISLIAVVPLGPFRTFGTIWPIIVARAALLLHRGTIVVASLDHLVVLIFVAIILAALLALLVEARPAFAQHPIIMVGILEVIFGLDAVAGELRIARHALVFLQELGGIAALAIVLAIAVRPPGNVARRLSSTSAAAVALLSIDQILILMPQVPASGGP